MLSKCFISTFYHVEHLLSPNLLWIWISTNNQNSRQHSGPLNIVHLWGKKIKESGWKPIVFVYFVSISWFPSGTPPFSRPQLVEALTVLSLPYSVFNGHREGSLKSAVGGVVIPLTLANTPNEHLPPPTPEPIVRHLPAHPWAFNPTPQTHDPGMANRHIPTSRLQR